MSLTPEMRIFSGLILTIGSLFFICILLIAFYSKKKSHNVQNRLYRYLLLVILVLLISEIIASMYLTVDNHSNTLFVIMLRFHWYTGIVWSTFLYFYSICFLQEVQLNTLIELAKNRKRVLYTSIFMLIATIVYIFLPLETITMDTFTYIPGIAAYYVLSYCAILVSMIMFFTLIRCRGISFRKKVTVVIMIVEVVVILGLQMLFQDIAFMGLGATLQMFFLYFIIENPDLQIVNDLEKTQNSIDKSSKTKLEFLSNMSDEMNVPINEIIRYSKLNLNTSNFDQEKVKTNIRYMMKSGNNLLDIINNVLDMSTLESSDEVLNQREYSLYNLLKELTDFTKEKIGDKPISFVINVEENTPSIVYGDYSKLYQALLNVLSNAVKYTNVGKIMLTISCEYKNDTSIIKFVVTDTGEGIKEEDFDKVFTKYETADDTESNTKGATVGLVISKKHIELMGGEITFESNYGVGSTFYVSVPQKIINSSPIQNINELNNTTNNSIPFHDYSKYTVLVVDDDTLNLEVTRKLLEKNKINVETVKTGNECIYNIKSDKQYDLILMDDMMSEMTGIEVIHALKKLKEQDGYKVPPVVALTATVMTGVEEVYLNEGFNDYLPKPINASSLNKLISKYLNRNQI